MEVRMRRNIPWVIVVGILAILTACEGGVVVGSKSLSFQSDKFIYGEGYVISMYRHPFEKVWKALEETVQELRFTNVEKEKKIGRGKIAGVLNGEKVVFKVAYTDRELTEVSVLVGLGGNNIAAQFLHEKIAGKLKNI